MDLLIKGQLFIVGGASSGFGKAVTDALVVEGASVITIARGADKLQELKDKYPDNIEIASCDITDPASTDLIVKMLAGRQLHGILFNGGGPPAMAALETTLQDWDNAYKTLLRWKVDLLQRILPMMIDKKYGRIVFIESASVKQPIENLVLSNALRVAVVGYAKTVSQEVSHFGVTLNVLAPGYHDTAAMDRIVQKKIASTGNSKEEIIQDVIAQTSVGFIGDPNDLASLASWLLSPHSRFITGQTISVAGGAIKGLMG